MLTDAQRDAIPDDLLRPTRAGALDLCAWLRLHGWQMTLAELEDERNRRGMRRTRGA